MDGALTLAGLAMGLAATPHCLLMCGAPCAALTQGSRRGALGFQGGRLLGYMAGGALAAGSIGALGAWSQATPALRPLWLALHMGFLSLGLWWLAAGRSPAWMKRSVAVSMSVPVQRVGNRPKPWRASLAGLAWVAWPCGALQAALLLSALASSAAGGALVMAAFALGSMPALLAAPWARAQWRRVSDRMPPRRWLQALDLRIAGLGLVLASGWAISHGLWTRLAAFCAS